MKIVGVLKYRDREGIGAMHKWLAEYKHNTLIRSSSKKNKKAPEKERLLLWDIAI